MPLQRRVLITLHRRSGATNSSLRTCGDQRTTIHEANALDGQVVDVAAPTNLAPKYMGEKCGLEDGSLPAQDKLLPGLGNAIEHRRDWNGDLPRLVGRDPPVCNVLAGLHAKRARLVLPAGINFSGTYDNRRPAIRSRTRRPSSKAQARVGLDQFRDPPYHPRAASGPEARFGLRSSVRRPWPFRPSPAQGGAPAMRDHNKAFCRTIAQVFDCPEPVFEFGSYQVEGQEGYANLRGLFPQKSYVGCDMRPGPGVDRVEDVTAINLPDASAGTVLCIETFEHVFEVQKAFEEVYRLLKPGGIFVITSPLNFRIHGYPDDYWRMTPNCLRRPARSLRRAAGGLSGLSRISPHGHGRGHQAADRAGLPAEARPRRGQIQRLAPPDEDGPAAPGEDPPVRSRALPIQGRAASDCRLLHGRVHDRVWPRSRLCARTRTGARDRVGDCRLRVTAGSTARTRGDEDRSYGQDRRSIARAGPGRCDLDGA